MYLIFCLFLTANFESGPVSPQDSFEIGSAGGVTSAIGAAVCPKSKVAPLTPFVVIPDAVSASTVYAGTTGPDGSQVGIPPPMPDGVNLDLLFQKVINARLGENAIQERISNSAAGVSSHYLKSQSKIIQEFIDSIQANPDLASMADEIDDNLNPGQTTLRFIAIFQG